jgi:hypothetical protein
MCAYAVCTGVGKLCTDVCMRVHVYAHRDVYFCVRAPACVYMHGHACAHTSVHALAWTCVCLCVRTPVCSWASPTRHLEPSHRQHHSITVVGTVEHLGLVSDEWEVAETFC